MQRAQVVAQFRCSITPPCPVPPLLSLPAGQLDPSYVIEYKSDEALHAVSTTMDGVAGQPMFGAATPAHTAANTKNFVADIMWALEPLCKVDLTAQAGPGGGFSKTVFKNIPPGKTLDLHAALRGPESWMTTLQAAHLSYGTIFKIEGRADGGITVTPIFIGPFRGPHNRRADH